MVPINLRSFAQKVRFQKKRFVKYLSNIENNPPKNLDKIADEINNEIWKEVDCLSCGNCCKKMTPTFTDKDISRISSHFEMSKKEFKEKWLYFDKKDGDWMNYTTPCQFLDLKNNICSIYEVRPTDCADFPHLNKKKMVDYIHVHQQNIQYCPATFKMVEKMIERI